MTSLGRAVTSSAVRPEATILASTARRARAGFGKIDISSSAVGAKLVGYRNREGEALSIHDSLFARSVVLECDGQCVVLCSVDLCFVNEAVVAAAREQIARETGITPPRVFVSATHTHSGPLDTDRIAWPDGLSAQIAASVSEAFARLQPAEVGVGWGMLHGHTLNRRRLEDPVDPAVFVIRVDAADGAPLGVYYGFACHPVVLGPDNRQISGDWPASCSQAIEAHLGPGGVAVFGQGACADVNPLTEAVRDRIAAARAVRVQVESATYYGSCDPAAEEFDVSDRFGGTFAEAERLGRAVAEEAMRVYRGIAPESVRGVWTRQIAVTLPPGQASLEGPLGTHACPVAGLDEPLEVMLVGIDGPGILLIGQPGEVFAETGVRLRRELRRVGTRHPFVAGYANGWRAYLAPGHAYSDGGYEVDWARAVGLPMTLQDDIHAAILAVLQEDVDGSAGT